MPFLLVELPFFEFTCFMLVVSELPKKCYSLTVGYAM